MKADSRYKLFILGNRTFAEEVADLANDCDQFELVGFVENENKERCSEVVQGLPIIWFEDLAPFVNTHHCLSGLTQRNRYAAQMSLLKMQFATLIHPTANISRTTTIGEGAVVSVGSIVAAHTSIGKHVLINRGAIIGHHAVIEDFANIMPGANIAGNTRIGEGAYIGMGAIVINSLSVGRGAIVGAGAVVTKDVPAFVQVVGNPARIVKELAGGG